MITLTGHCLNCGKHYVSRQESIYDESASSRHQCEREIMCGDCIKPIRECGCLDE